MSHKFDKKDLVFFPKRACLYYDFYEDIFKKTGYGPFTPIIILDEENKEGFYIIDMFYREFDEQKDKEFEHIRDFYGWQYKLRMPYYNCPFFSEKLLKIKEL